MATVLAQSAPAMAQDQDVEISPSAEATFGLDQLGLGSTIELSALGSRTQLTMPVPEGTTPAELTAIATVPAWLSRGWIDIEAAGRPLSRILLDNTAPTMPVSIPLFGAPIVDGAVTVDLWSTLISDDLYCPDFDANPVRLFDAVVTYNGTPSVPRTISEFLPPLLRQLTVFVPSEPDRDVITAAMSFTTSVVSYYGAQPVRVVVRPANELQGADVDGPFDRSVVLASNTDPGAELIYPDDQSPPRLFVTGSGTRLIDQTRLITSAISQLAVTTSALAGASAPSPILAPDVTTLDDLAIGTVTGIGSGSATASIALDQTRLGRSTSGLSVHLIGSYNPGPGSVTASIGGTTVADWAADDMGRIDRWIDIPDSSLGRVTTVDVTVTHPVNGALECGALVGAKVTIDGSTSVRSTKASPTTTLGFDSMPQSLMPRFNVALSDYTFADTVRAVSILNGLQRLSTRPLLPNAVSIDDALDSSDPTLIIAPGGDLPDSITLPLSSADGETFTVTGTENSAELSVDTQLPYAALQVAARNDAALMVASSADAPAELDRLLAWLDSDPTRWFELSGDILFSAPEIEPVSLSSNELASSETSTATDTEDNGMGRGGLIALGIGALVVLVAAAAALRWRLRSDRGGHRRGDTQAP
jgi:hypothetical protein